MSGKRGERTNMLLVVFDEHWVFLVEAINLCPMKLLLIGPIHQIAEIFACAYIPPADKWINTKDAAGVSRE